MNEKAELKNKGIIKLTIYMVAFLLLGQNAINPAMSAISAAFPEKTATQIQLMSQLPMLMSIPFILFGGVISKKVDRKTLITVGLLCYLIGGTGGAYTENFTWLVCSRCILGFGIGILNPATMGLISDLFFGTDDYSPTVGVENACKSIGGVVYTLITGYLCAISWHSTFLVYLLGVPVLIFLIIFVPRMPAQEKLAKMNGEEVKKEEKKSKISSSAVPLLVCSMILACGASFCTSITNSNASYLVTSNGFGTSVEAGYVASACTLFCVVGSTIFAKVSNKTKGATLLIAALIVGGIGLIIAGLASNLVMCFIGVGLVLGTGLGFINPAMMMQVGKLNKDSSTLFFSLILASMNLGSTLQGLIVPTAAASIFGGEGVGSHAYLFGGCCMVLVVLWELFIKAKFLKEEN